MSFRLYSCGHLCTNVPSTFSLCGHRCSLASALNVPSAYVLPGVIELVYLRCSHCALHSFEKRWLYRERAFRLYTCGHPCLNVLYAIFSCGHSCTCSTFHYNVSFAQTCIPQYIFAGILVLKCTFHL